MRLEDIVELLKTLEIKQLNSIYISYIDKQDKERSIDIRNE